MPVTGGVVTQKADDSRIRELRRPIGSDTVFAVPHSRRRREAASLSGVAWRRDFPLSPGTKKRPCCTARSGLRSLMRAISIVVRSRDEGQYSHPSSTSSLLSSRLTLSLPNTQYLRPNYDEQSVPHHYARQGRFRICCRRWLI